MSAHRVINLLTGFILALAASTLFAQDSPSLYPNKPIHLIVPYAPGGINDLLGRIAGEKLTQALGQTVIVENRPGAGGSLATALVAKSKPDGYTLLLGSSAPLAVALSLYPSLSYDVMKDLAPVSLVAKSDLVIVANPNLPARSLKELVTLARERPSTLKVGVPSAGSMHHLIIEELSLKANIKFIVVPFNSEAPVLNSLLGDHIDIAVLNVSTPLPHIRQKTLTPLVVTSKHRSELLPTVQTSAEAGYPGLIADPWFATVAPAGTPKEIITKLNAEITKVLALPEIKKRFASELAVTATSSTPEQTSSFIQGEIVRWAKIAKDSGAKFD